MMRSRAKAVGLGLALFAGQAVASDPWNPAAPTASDPIWLSPRKPAPQPAAVPAPPAGLLVPIAPKGDIRPSPIAALPAIPAIPDGSAKGPGTVVPGPTPEVGAPAAGLAIPPLPDAWQPVPQPGVAVRHELQEPAPPPRATEPPRALPLPKPSPVEPPPTPRVETPRPADPPRVIAPVQHELPCAPPELMVPHGIGVPGIRGTFGSPPISLSRDYPACRDILDNMGVGHSRLFAPPTGGPATDRLHFGAEYLLWWVNAQEIPVLGTTSVTGGDGFLSDPGTRLLLGPGSFGDTLRHGLRLRGGWWCDEAGTLGVDGSLFFTGRRTSSASFDSGTIPTIARPFFAPNINGEFSEIVSRPNFSTGALLVDASSEFWGADVNLRHAICRRCDFRHEVFVGYRFLGLKESLVIGEAITALENVRTRTFPARSCSCRTASAPGTASTAGRSAGWSSGSGGTCRSNCGRRWRRATRQEVEITGTQDRLIPGGQPERFTTGGLLAAGPNIGTFSQSKFSVVPEATLNLGYWVTPNAKAFVGYNVLYWSNVIRPGDQIDRVVNIQFVPNPAMGTPPSNVQRPLPTFKQSDLWANGLQFGVEFRW